jgi:lipopolysaccharide transport system ATP-binding protein
MSSDRLALRLSGVSKRYRIVSAADRPTGLAATFARRLRHPLRRAPRDQVDALRDVTFDVAEGEAVGIIGRNGAGKSTLLKILSRITTPSGGRIDLYGRVGSLLEVGTGFHPELTGRENCYLNGAILGMTKREIDRQFDSIVEFAGIGRFLNTPVKRYSTGMYIRLGFAVAAHLNPEILIVDEVLAVGDVQFQKKCLGKMSEVTSEQGRTVLFVSHNMAAVEALCPRTVYLEGGRVMFDGPTPEAIMSYLSRGDSAGVEESRGEYDLSQAARDETAGPPILRKITILGPDGRATDAVRMGDPISFAIDVDGLDLPAQSVGIRIRTELDLPVASVNMGMLPPALDKERVRPDQVVLHVPRLPLLPGRYSVELAVDTFKQSEDRVERAATFDVEAADVYGTGHGMPTGPAHGLLYLDDARWEIRENGAVRSASSERAS